MTTFFPPDPVKFRLLQLSYDAFATGGSAPCTLNAADEIAVEAFLQGRIGFLTIHEIVQETLARLAPKTPRTIGDILEMDRESRALARQLAGDRAASPATV